MKPRLSSLLYSIVFILSLLALCLLLCHSKVHAQDKTPEQGAQTPAPAFFIVENNAQGEKYWAEIKPKKQVKLYCDDGNGFSPCGIIDADGDAGILFLGAVSIDGKEEKPTEKPSSFGGDPLRRAER